MTRKVVAIMGPTASGKTALAVELVKRFPAAVVSVDSAQVYRRLDIGSAKPDAEELVETPHRLIDIREPWDSYSAAEFVEDARQACEQIWSDGKTPLLVGGTMLYFRALQDGLSPLPAAEPSVRAAITAEAQRLGWRALHGRLAQVDPEAAERIEPNDSQRIQRALEVHRLTGHPLSELQHQPGEGALDCAWLKVAVCPRDRAILHQRIESRFDLMLERGLIDEVAGLRTDSRLHAELPSMRSVGYRQVWQFLDGDLEYDQMRAAGIAASRQLAKRQITWLRREPALQWIDPTRPRWMETATERIAHFLDICM